MTGAVDDRVPMRWQQLRSEVELLRRTPGRMRAHLLLTMVAALTLPIVFTYVAPLPCRQEHRAQTTAMVLIAFSVLNVEIGRILMGGVSRNQQAHKALSGWAFASALLLPPVFLLLVVPLTYAHAYLRGLRVAWWKWIGSAAYLVLAGIVAALVRSGVLGGRELMHGTGALGLLALVLCAASFLVVETGLLWCSALLNHADDEVWLRQTLTAGAFYGTELSVLLVCGLLSAVWTRAPWFVLLTVPVYLMIQRAALYQPMRERAEAAAALAATNEELEHANAFKVDLLGMLGHEIGNPLTSVVGYAEIGAEAAEVGDTATVTRSLAVIGRAGLQVQDMVAEVLTMVASESGALTAFPESCLLLPRLRELASSGEPNHQPAVDCPPDACAWVQPLHLEQMLRNLLSNAEKYADGASRITVVEVGETVEIHVVDAGPGVPPEFRDALFSRFGRAESHRRVRGTGLGLFITRELARANAGDVRYEPGSPGSDFVLTLPRA
ncbi:sensor histidine kinase [Nocardioides acrostichi]|uniref:histidine kinase n=1 Tax=Nocardioides acrostichi TaxID=2784339 RepID=A0A930V214_9ACTN|nr:HAMP domain-containing sensor histidine kinase [Nocardioides acrostichi]MBF4162436.1 HAMP domain-containing histidine kinase [Nocardioides acrostichi]